MPEFEVFVGASHPQTPQIRQLSSHLHMPLTFHRFQAKIHI